MSILITDLWPADFNFVEFGARDGALGAQLLARGYERYLGVADGQRQRERLIMRHPRLRTHVAVDRRRDCVRANNGDVLVLHGPAAADLARFRNIRHARYVACPVRPGPMLLWAIVFGLVQFLLGRLAWPRIVRFAPRGTAAPRLLAYRVRRPRPHEATRRFIPHRWGIEGFFQRLGTGGVRHVVLRWFESLPELPAGEDLDILVDDRHLEAVRDILDSGPGLQPVDVYSANGVPGADFRSLPYYPPYLAEQLLTRSVDHGGLCAVPSPRDHFLSLAYHALYHKGAASGLPGKHRRWRRSSRPEHDYAGVLTRLARQLRIDVPITLDDLDAYLDSQGWRPPHDMLVRLARKNAWLRRRLKQAPASADDDGLTVFLLRREALGRGGVERATALLRENGFQIVESISLDPRRAETVARSVRGGNWGQGPWSLSGGSPVAAIVTYDGQPIRPTRRQRRRFPFLGNARLLVKEQIRDAFNAGLPSDQHCNVVHSSDNGREAVDYLRIVAPERADEILARFRERQNPAITTQSQSRAA